MTLLRIYGSLLGQPQHCRWTLSNNGREMVSGEGPLADIPRRAQRVQLVVPSAQILITRTRLPPGVRHRAESVLAFSVEERIAGEPDANQVSWLGAVAGEDVLAVMDRGGLERWYQALGTLGIYVDEVQAEGLLLPIQAGEWSIFWSGDEGFVRTGQFEVAATDCGEREVPPMVLRLMLEQAKACGTSPTSIALYGVTPGVSPDIGAWQKELGVPLHNSGNWDWSMAPTDGGISLVRRHQHWRVLEGLALRLRPAAWILGAALTLHAAALIIDWTVLTGTQRALRQQMEAQFRGVFPEALAVVDPVLQMRRKLVEARHGAGQTDESDFLPMMEQVAAAAKDLPDGAVRRISYESGRVLVELSAIDEAQVRRVVASLLEAGLSVETAPPPLRPSGGLVLLTVRTT